MPDLRSERIIFAVGLAAIVVLVVALIPAYHAYNKTAPSAEPELSSTSRTVAQREAYRLTGAARLAWAGSAPHSAVASAARSSSAVVAEAPSRTPKVRSLQNARQPVSLTLAAPRGDCWVEVRQRSATGKLLYTGTVTKGKSFEFVVERLWIRFGAPQNVDLALNGKRFVIPVGTLNVLVTPGGVRSAAA